MVIDFFGTGMVTAARLKNESFPEFRIVSEELWDRVQARLAEVHKTWPGGKRHGFQGAKGNAVSLYPQELLSGAMVCGVCGATIVKVSGKGGGYYGCHRAAKHGCENRIIVRKKVVERVILGELSTRLSNTDSLAYVFRRVQQMVAKEFCESPGAAKRKEAEYRKQRQMLDNLVRYIAQGRQSKAIEEALAECEKKVEQLGNDLEFLSKCHTRLFKAPSKEWIEDRVSKIKEVLELKTERSALLLRRLLGRIVAEPAETEDGFRYLKAKTSLKCLALLEKEPATKTLPSLPEGVATGSTTFRWRAPSERIRTASEIPIEVDLMDEDAAPTYIRIAENVLHLRRLGMTYAKICDRLGVNRWMALTAARWGRIHHGR